MNKLREENHLVPIFNRLFQGNYFHIRTCYAFRDEEKDTGPISRMKHAFCSKGCHDGRFFRGPDYYIMDYDWDFLKGLFTVHFEFLTEDVNGDIWIRKTIRPEHSKGSVLPATERLPPPDEVPYDILFHHLGKISAHLGTISEKLSALVSKDKTPEEKGKEKVREAENAQKENECPICLEEDIVLANRMLLDAEGHWVCTDCWDAADGFNNCPICRKELPRDYNLRRRKRQRT